ncbi:hypothetical protein EBT31_17845 [bacterium]|nr:hypothetical protein [bacterium]
MVLVLDVSMACIDHGVRVPEGGTTSAVANELLLVALTNRSWPMLLEWKVVVGPCAFTKNSKGAALERLHAP